MAISLNKHIVPKPRIDNTSKVSQTKVESQINKFLRTFPASEFVLGALIVP